MRKKSRTSKLTGELAVEAQRIGVSAKARVPQTNNRKDAS